MKQFILILLSVMAITSGLRGQTTSTIQTMDLSLSHAIKVNDSIVGPERLVLNVKIGDIANTKKLYFMIDTMANSSAIMSVVGTVVRSLDVYKVQYNGYDYPFSYYTATIPVTIITDNQRKLFVTFYAEDQSGYLTNRIYFKF